MRKSQARDKVSDLRWWWDRLWDRQPHAVIQTQLDDGSEIPQLIRWWLVPRNRFLNVYLHKVIWDDVDRALHDHPWWSFSVLLKGRLGEVDIDPDFEDPYDGTSLETPLSQYPERTRFFRPGQLRLRKPYYLHRLVLPNKAEPAWTLFITGPRIRQWGFLCDKGWTLWTKFVERGKDGKMRGCGED